MNKNTIRLTEDDITRIVEQCTRQFLNESCDEQMEEGWLGDKWKQAKSAASTMFQNGENVGSVKDRFNQARTNWKSQGELNDLTSLRQSLEKFVEDGQLNPQMTIAQLIGGKYNGNKFGRISGMQANRKGQISRRGGRSY